MTASSEIKARESMTIKAVNAYQLGGDSLHEPLCELVEYGFRSNDFKPVNDLIRKMGVRARGDSIEAYPQGMRDAKRVVAWLIFATTLRQIAGTQTLRADKTAGAPVAPSWSKAVDSKRPSQAVGWNYYQPLKAEKLSSVTELDIKGLRHQAGKFVQTIIEGDNKKLGIMPEEQQHALAFLDYIRAFDCDDDAIAIDDALANL